MIKKPLIKTSRYDDIDDTNITIKKMLAITDILFSNRPNDKRFRKQELNYNMDLFLIMYRVESNEHYSDEAIQRDINILYNKIFKNRRHL